MATLGNEIVVVGDRKYSVIPHTGKKALNFDCMVSGIWTKIMGNVRANAGTADEKTARLAKFVDAFVLALADMTEDEFDHLVGMTFENVTVVGEGKEPNIPLNSVDAVGDHFADHKSDMNLVMLRVWEVNRLSPFE